MLIGAHVRTADGLDHAAAYAAETGCECIQVFAKSPQIWRAPYRSSEELALFRDRRAALDIGPVFTHAAYLINAGTADRRLRAMSRDAIADEVVRAAGLGASGIVLHMGTAASEDRGENADRVAEVVAAAWEKADPTPDTPPVLLENAAGAGRSYGRDVEQLCDAFQACRAKGVPVGLCLDTCHGFAAGWDLRDGEGWARVCEELDACGALSAVTLIHANDCRGGLGEHRDRHEWIGDGYIGDAGFSAMFAEPRLSAVPVIVEMPGDPPLKDVENVRRLKTLRAAASAGAGPDPEIA